MKTYRLKRADGQFLVWAGYPAQWSPDPLRALKVTKERADKLAKEWDVAAKCQRVEVK